MHWYYTKEVTDSKTPSRADGVDVDMEMRYRKEGARFIMELGNKLGLRYLTMATGIVFYHRFYMNQSFKNFSRWVTGTACLFLAGKVEETPKKCKDVLRTCRQMLSDHQWEAFGENPREEVMMHERILLQTIKFDLQVDHPYQYLIKYGKGLKGDKERINELVQKAWIFINDSLSTCICLQYKPPVVALAMLHLAAKLSKQSMQNFTPVPRQDWWRHFSPEIEQSVLDDICNEMMDLYDSSRRKSKLREGSGSKSKDGSMTDSPAYTPSASPQVSGSPPAKKKRNMSASIADANKPKDSPLAKPPQVENVSPPISMKLSQASTQPTQPMTLPSTQTIPTSQTHGHYFQHGFKFMGIPQKDVLQVGQDLVQQQQNTRQPMMSTAQLIQNQQALGNVYGHGIPMHSQGMQSSQGMPSQVISQSQGMPPSQGIPQHGTPHGHMMPREQMPLTVDQGHYAYSMAQQQQQPQQQQQHMHSYAPSQMPPVSQWQAQQQSIGPGWMK